MDPVTQGALGAVVAQGLAGRRKLAAIACYGAVAGMAPDLDVLIQSPDDPLLFLEFHRQFTHSLFFIPFGALVVAWLMYWLGERGCFWKGLSWREAYLASLAGYATHGLLDACTSYGTQLFWPFTDFRAAWDLISIIDPVFTFPILAAVLLAGSRHRRWIAGAACGWAALYLSVGALQQQRALDAAMDVAALRGHVPEQISVKPSFANLLLWKAIYRHEGRFYVDGIRAGTEIRWCVGQSIEALKLERDFPALAADSLQARDIQRFRWFSDDHLAVHQGYSRIVDMRYSLIPTSIDPMWGIEVDQGQQDRHVRWWADRTMSADQRRDFLSLLLGGSCVAL
ncbi:MAG: metal-dependent hydrolase [OM182 bacterium]|nr:MAG: metal-dependent hydrolase [OM182 bacterium]